MLDRLVAAITDLPVIVQGAMGSALFALLMYFGQKLSARFANRLAESSKKRQHQALIDELAVLSIYAAEDVTKSTRFAVLVLYRAARYGVRALYWLTLGLIFGSTISVFGIVGYLGCLYYLVQTLRLVQGPSDEQLNNAASRVKQIQNELDKTASQ